MYQLNYSGSSDLMLDKTFYNIKVVILGTRYLGGVWNIFHMEV